jgi:uncharacterized protein
MPVPLPCTTLTTACMALMLFVLSGRVLCLRIQLRQPLGDGGHARLARAVRAQANFTEHVPLALIVLLLLEWQGAPVLAVQAYGGLLVAARALHAVGLSQVDERLAWRAVGTVVTLALLSLGAVGLLVGPGAS